MVTSSSVVVDEEFFPWRGADAHRPLAPATSSQPQYSPASVPSSVPPPSAGSTMARTPNVVGVPDRGFTLLNLFSGPYNRSGGLKDALLSRGWSKVVQVDNDSVSGGGWSDDILNDETYTRLLLDAKRGSFDGIMIAIDCSIYLLGCSLLPYL